MDIKPISDQWRIPDPLWGRFQAILPKYPVSPKGGQPRLNPRRVLDGIFYVLRTGCQWKAAPREFGSGSALHNYFQDWTRRGLFREIWRIALEEYDDLKGIDWEWQSIDGAMTKAPLGGEKDGQDPHRSGQEGGQALGPDRRGRGAGGGGGGRGQRARQVARRRDVAEHAGGGPGADPRGAAALLRRQGV